MKNRIDLGIRSFWFIFVIFYFAIIRWTLHLYFLFLPLLPKFSRGSLPFSPNNSANSEKKFCQIRKFDAVVLCFRHFLEENWQNFNKIGIFLGVIFFLKSVMWTRICKSILVDFYMNIPWFWSFYISPWNVAIYMKFARILPKFCQFLSICHFWIIWQKNLPLATVMSTHYKSRTMDYIKERRFERG